MQRYVPKTSPAAKALPPNYNRQNEIELQPHTRAALVCRIPLVALTFFPSFACTELLAR